MSILKVNKLESTTSGGDCVVNATNISNHNLIINGACFVAQRGTSSTANGYKTVDRVDPYSVSHNAGTITYSQSDITSGAAWDAGFRNAFKLATSQAGNTTTAACYVSSYVTKIEAQDIANSGWDYTDPTSKVTLSFWIKASTADDFQIQLVTDDGTKKKYNTTVAATTSWTKVTKTIPGHADLTFNNDNGKGLTIQLVLATGDDMTGTVTQDTWVANTTAQVKSSKVGNTWITAGAGSVEATGFQLELGEAASLFQHRPYGDELVRCQRYFQHHFSKENEGQTFATRFTTQAQGGITYYTALRSAPTATLKGINIHVMSSGANADVTSMNMTIGGTNVTTQTSLVALITAGSLVQGEACLAHGNAGDSPMGLWLDSEL